MNSEAQQRFGQAKKLRLPKQCRECDVFVCMQRGVPQEPIRYNQGWRTGAQLSLPRIFGFLPTCQTRHESNGESNQSRIELLYFRRMAA